MPATIPSVIYRDRLPAHRDVIDLRQMVLDLPGREPLRIQADHVARPAVETAPVLAPPSQARRSPPGHGAPEDRPRRSRWRPAWGSTRCASSPSLCPPERDAHSPDARSSRPRDRSGGTRRTSPVSRPSSPVSPHALGARLNHQQFGPVGHRRLAGSLARRHSRHAKISRRHDPPQPTAPGRGPSDHARYTKFPSVTVGLARAFCHGVTVRPLARR